MTEVGMRWNEEQVPPYDRCFVTHQHQFLCHYLILEQCSYMIKVQIHCAACHPIILPVKTAKSSHLVCICLRPFLWEGAIKSRGGRSQNEWTLSCRCATVCQRVCVNSLSTMTTEEKYFLYKDVCVPHMIYPMESLKYYEEFTFRPDDILIVTYPKSGEWECLQHLWSSASVALLLWACSSSWLCPLFAASSGWNQNQL